MAVAFRNACCVRIAGTGDYRMVTTTDSALRRGLAGRGDEFRLTLDPGFQGLQLASSIWLAYCQPLVGAFFNFQLQDDPSLSGWQSGVLYADGTRKPGYRLVRSVLARAAVGTLEC